MLQHRHEEKQNAPRRSNRARVLEALSMAPGPMAVRDIARVSGLTDAQVRAELAEPVAVGTVQDFGGRYWV